MQKYNIEGNINFYDELFKSLDADSDDEATLCQITSFPLEQNSVTLECNHKFNYEPLYKEICRQKFNFKTYDFNMLTKQDQIKVKNSNLDYFIKCPYCRNIQFTVLPYYQELKLEKRYGINSLDDSLPDKPKHKHFSNITCHYGSDDYTFYSYGKLFKKGQCCFQKEHKLCTGLYVAPVENTNVSFCRFHYRIGIKKLKYEEKEKKIAEKEKKIAEKFKEKQSMLEERQKLLDEKNAERLAKGLLPLKRLPVVKKKLQNVVQKVQHIGEYIPDKEEDQEDEKIQEKEEDKEQENIGCKSILKSGPNKGLKCGCKKINEHGLCKRHSTNYLIKNDL